MRRGRMHEVCCLPGGVDWTKVIPSDVRCILPRVEQPFTTSGSQEIETGALRVTSAWFAPSLRLGRHHHARGSISVILAGGYDSVIGGVDKRCGAQTVVMTPPAEPH